MPPYGEVSASGEVGDGALMGDSRELDNQVLQLIVESVASNWSLGI